MDTNTLWNHNGNDHFSDIFMDIHHAIQHHITIVNAWSETKRTNIEACNLNINKGWWKLKGFKYNFGIFRERFVICYKCLQRMNSNNINDYVAHVNSISHMKRTETFYALNAKIPEEIKFPSFRIQAFPNTVAIKGMIECPYIKKFYSRDSSNLTNKVVRQSSGFNKSDFRNYVFARENYHRQLTGKLNIFEDIIETKRLDLKVDYQWKGLKPVHKYKEDAPSTPLPKRKRDVKLEQKLVSTKSPAPVVVKVNKGSFKDREGYHQEILDYISNLSLSHSNVLKSTLRSYHRIMKRVMYW